MPGSLFLGRDWASALGYSQRLPRRPLRRVPGRALPSGARRARGRVLHPARVERRAPTLKTLPRRAPRQQDCPCPACKRKASNRTRSTGLGTCDGSDGSAGRPATRDPPRDRTDERIVTVGVREVRFLLPRIHGQRHVAKPAGDAHHNGLPAHAHQRLDRRGVLR
jgi:hypothetical protein